MMNASISLRALSCSIIVGTLLISGQTLAELPRGPRANQVTSKAALKAYDGMQARYAAHDVEDISDMYAGADDDVRDARRVGPRNTIRR